MILSISSTLIRLILYRLLKNRMLHTGEILALGLFEGAVVYYALHENPAVGAGCALGFGARLLVDYAKAPDPVNICCSLLGLALGILMSSVIEQLWEEISTLFEDDPKLVGNGDVLRTRRRTVHTRRRSARTHMPIPGAPDPDPPSIQLTRRTRYNVPETPVRSQWEALQAPIDKRVGLENEVLELRRRASEAAGETRRLQEERKWAISQGNRAREFQLGLDLKNFQQLSESLNRRAAEMIAIARGQSLLAKDGDIEVRSLTPAEAVTLTDYRIRKAKARGETFVRVSLTGGRLKVSQHEKANERELRTVLEGHLRGKHHSVVNDPSNGSYLIVSVDAYRSPSSTSVPASDEWSRALD